MFQKSILILLTISFASLLSATEEITSTRSAIHEWVQTEKIISSEAADWNEKQAVMKDMLKALREEASLLEDKIRRGNASLSDADSKRALLIEQEKQLAESMQALEPFLLKMENKLLDFKGRLPEPLLSKLEAFYLRLPEAREHGNAKTRLSIAERMQTVVGILLEINRFNDVMTLSREIKTLDDGRQGEVKTLYVGLGVAYYLSPGGENAGYGYPEGNTWVWKSDKRLSPRIKDAIAMYEGGTQSAHFVQLPVEVK